MDFSREWPYRCTPMSVNDAGHFRGVTKMIGEWPYPVASMAVVMRENVGIESGECKSQCPA